MILSMQSLLVLGSVVPGSTSQTTKERSHWIKRKLLHMPINPKEVYSTTKEWHLVYCLFYWRKKLRNRFTGVIVEP